MPLGQGWGNTITLQGRNKFLHLAEHIEVLTSLENQEAEIKLTGERTRSSSLLFMDEL